MIIIAVMVVTVIIIIIIVKIVSNFTKYLNALYSNFDRYIRGRTFSNTASEIVV